MISLLYSTLQGIHLIDMSDRSRSPSPNPQGPDREHSPSPIPERNYSPEYRPVSPFDEQEVLDKLNGPYSPTSANLNEDYMIGYSPTRPTTGKIIKRSRSRSRSRGRHHNRRDR